MADIKTNLRELSVAITLGMLKRDDGIAEKTNLYKPKKFLEEARSVIYNSINSATTLLIGESQPEYNQECRDIIDNGYKLAKKIFENPEFNIKKDDKIEWLGFQTQKGDPIDIKIGDYGFSLKEDSFILKNMGLYSLLNYLTGGNYQRGLHIFSTFANAEYDAWFCYTWSFLSVWLDKKNKWELIKGNNKSVITKEGSYIVLQFNSDVSKVPIEIKTNSEYMRYTTSKTREKTFSKWINEIIYDDPTYLKYKKHCSEVAGVKVRTLIKDNFNPNHVYEFFQIYDKPYYYAKSTKAETTILKVPSKSDFNDVIEFVDCEYSVPASQLNIITTFRNKKTNKQLQFRNECRFSHGQFNGTPEAKMYVVSDTPLTDLYEPL